MLHLMWWDMFSVIADITSIIGFVLTCVIFWNLRKIKKKYLFKALVPGLIKNLDNHATAILSFHSNFVDSAPDIKLELGRSLETLKALSGKLDKSPQNKSANETVARCLQLVSNYPMRADTKKKEVLWDIYVEMRAVVDSIQYHIDVFEWDRT
jgi:hypothetical protein